MTNTNAHNALRRRFATLTEEQKDNVRFHLEHRTPIIVGEDAMRFYFQECQGIEGG